MPESKKTRLTRIGFNYMPAFWCTGAKVTYIADDFHEVRIKLPLNWRTKNYVGTIFGGSMYAATDSLYFIMLVKILGQDYVVWDRTSTIQYKKPGRETLYTQVIIDPDEIVFIRNELEINEKINQTYQIELADKEGVVHAIVEKTLHIGKR